MVRKRLRTFLIAILVCCLAATFYYTQKPIVLTIGVFAGSNWNVPSPYSGKIIDNVIERFEKTHPNVPSGICEWNLKRGLFRLGFKGSFKW